MQVIIGTLICIEIDSVQECKCGAAPQIMGHLILCPIDCSLQELKDVSEGAKVVAQF